MCQIGVPLQYCRVEVPGFRTYNLNKGSVDSDVSFSVLFLFHSLREYAVASHTTVKLLWSISYLFTRIVNYSIIYKSYEKVANSDPPGYRVS